MSKEEIFELYVEGVSASFIARRMMQKGYKTGTGKSEWTEKSVRVRIKGDKGFITIKSFFVTYFFA